MKFGRQMRLRVKLAWQPHYVDYTTLKLRIKQGVREGTFDAVALVAAMREQHARAVEFYRTHCVECETQFEELSDIADDVVRLVEAFRAQQQQQQQQRQARRSAGHATPDTAGTEPAGHAAADSLSAAPALDLASPAPAMGAEEPNMEMAAPAVPPDLYSAPSAAAVPHPSVAGLHKRVLDFADTLEDVKDFAALNLGALQRLIKKVRKALRGAPLDDAMSPLAADVADTGEGDAEAGAGQGSSMPSDAPRALAMSPREPPPELEEVEREVEGGPLTDMTLLDELDKRAEELVRRIPAPITRRRKLRVLEPKVHTVDRLDLESLPVGVISRLRVSLATNPLGSPISVPVMVARGRHAGPVLIISSAIHGNELNGIPLIHRLFKEIQCDELCGIVVALPVVNPAGYVRCQRAFSDGVDLNRIMPGKKDGNCSQRFAYLLLQRIMFKGNFLIDLHTASAGRVNSLYVRADMNDPVTFRMAMLQHPQIVVHSTGPDRSLRDSCMLRGIKSITVEIGDPQRFHASYIRHALIGVTNIMSFLKMTPSAYEEQTEADPVLCSRSYWIFTKEGGVLYVHPKVNTWVRRGECIAEITDLFGTLTERYLAPEDGIVIGKSVNPVCQTGDRILHLGIVSQSFAEIAVDGH